MHISIGLRKKVGGRTSKRNDLSPRRVLVNGTTHMNVSDVGNWCRALTDIYFTDTAVWGRPSSYDTTCDTYDSCGSWAYVISRALEVRVEHSPLYVPRPRTSPSPGYHYLRSNPNSDPYSDPNPDPNLNWYYRKFILRLSNRTMGAKCPDQPWVASQKQSCNECIWTGHRHCPIVAVQLLLDSLVAGPRAHQFRLCVLTWCWTFSPWTFPHTHFSSLSLLTRKNLLT